MQEGRVRACNEKVDSRLVEDGKDGQYRVAHREHGVVQGGGEVEAEE